VFLLHIKTYNKYLCQIKIKIVSGVISTFFCSFLLKKTYFEGLYFPVPLGRPRHRWEDNIKMDLKDVGWGVDWIELAQDRDGWRAVVNAVMNPRVP
jgi:hypothetical protein